MKIVADENIPGVQAYFGHVGELVTKPGRMLTREDLLDADILLARSVTRVDRALLEGTRVRFVGSAVTGTDHLDKAWLDAAGIAWYAAEGCNKQAVVEYVLAVLAALNKMAVFPDRPLRAGVVGAGRVGRLVVETLTLLGFDVVVSDPLRAAKEPDFQHTPLNDFQHLDLVTLHVPLTHHGEAPTYHLIDKTFLQRQQKGCVLLNTSRGAVIDFEELAEYGQHLYWCLDVWEHEPQVDFNILDLAAIATPHIAGYSLESKQRGTQMVYVAALARGVIPASKTPVMPPPWQVIRFDNATVDWADAILKIYDPRVTTDVMKTAIVENGSDATFDLLRKQFLARREFGSVQLRDLQVSEQDGKLLKALGLPL
jgi:erythronate-4-phosphate dehydrogenase